MRQPATRRFNLGDALILTGAIAMMLALAKSQPYGPDAFMWAGSARVMAFRVTRTVVGLLTPFAATLTLALLAMRLRRPRPDLPRLLRQPGASAALAAALVMAIDLAIILLTVLDLTSGGFQVVTAPFGELILGTSFRYVFPLGALPGHPDPIKVGPAVAAVWFVQALGRRRRPEPGWLDRSGTALGWAWIALMLAAWMAR